MDGIKHEADKEYIFSASFDEDRGLMFFPTGKSIVRCKHCKNKEQIEHAGALEYWCDIVDGFVTSDDYCSWGEPKEGNDGEVY